MNIYKTTITALMALMISPLAIAQIYRCEGPDGPIFSDKKCATDAATVQIDETSGLGGVTDQTKADLADKKRQREQDRSNGVKNYDVVNNSQHNLYNTESPGRWVRGRNRVNNPPVTRPVARPVTRPAKPVAGRRR